MQRIRWVLAAAILCSPAAWAATPASGPSGIDLAGIDHGVKPGDDFFRYANGGWLMTAQIPADRSSTGTFLKVFEQAEKNTAELIRDAGAGYPAAGSNARRIADYYAAWMDTATIERHGLAPLKPELAQIGAIASRADLARVLGSRLRADVDPVNATHFHTQNLFGLFVTQGLEDPSHSIAYLLQGGLGMPSRDYYLSSDPHMLATRGKYLTYIGALLDQAGTADAAAKAKTVLDLETKIAKAQTDLLDSQDIHKANNLWRMADFARKAPGLDWASYFKAAGLDGQQQIDTWQPNAVSGLSALVASEPLQAWKDLLLFHTINQSAGLLPKAYADLSFDFYGRTLQGTPQQQPRWKRAVGATSGDLGDAVGQLYVKHYFPASSKAEIEQLVKNLIAAFNDRIDTLSWMTPATREKAKAKLATLRVGVGYPDTWRDYGSLQIRADDALGNHLRAEKFEYEHQRAKLGQRVDKGEWWMTPQTVNAVNLPLQNALNFPAAILQPPFFDPHADAAANYGAIGSVIGHEISHSFDNMGAEFDAEGRLANWWTPEDLAHFKAAGQQLAKQFDRYEALPGLHVNGEQTLGENIADVSGLTIAYLAYHKSLGGKPAPVIDGLDGDQRFFLAYGQAWRSKIRDAAQRQRLATDVHAPADFRAQTVRNLDPWYPAFGVKPGEKLYLAPKDRVKIW
ncbi:MULTISPECIES: M13 family metallopeptidase [Rhodanobacter]|uniref:M13 family metallopeptidase n=1 Tax=Rhodanobacter TaxID=75309 RepID=UPI00042675CE|nr:MULTISPECIES: M13 family metallopeptidase [Rhodanobacter]KZC18470.1 peptidase M13 [Rhodanobacter denitrificans]UJM93063.1 M13 family metallopeptidase [Rhodanobacter denitrificans]UJM96594.1 M13 family metallopeptidase [Rhodanobacter denitrificans]UJN20576.1 M13 family metallopeptidase [Rhodanobacter denitrificans]